MHLTIAILAALVQRGHTGKGQLVEVAMQEAVLNLTRVKYTGTLASGQPLGRTGEGVNDYIYIIVPPDNPEMFHTAMEVIGRPELKEDERFKTAASRAKNGAALTEALESWTASRQKHDVMKAFAGRGIVCGAVLDTREVLSDPHLRERGTIFDLDHPTRGRFSMVGCPVRLSDSPVDARRAPLYGEHSEETLRLAGYTAAEARALRDKGVISGPRD